MALGTGSDIREILELDTGGQDEFITKDALFSDGKKVSLIAKPSFVDY